MASMELSLDDIIQKKFSKGPLRGKGGFRKFGGNNVAGNRPQSNPVRRQGAVPQKRIGALHTGTNQSVSDARNRIIQKKRQKMTDARDKLCELAKRTDARQKLLKLRERRVGSDGGPADLLYNGLSTNTKKRVGNAFKAGHVPTGFPPAIKLQRTISQPVSNFRFPHKVPALMEMDLDYNDDFVAEGSMHLRRTVNNDQMRIQPLLRPSKLSSSSSPYSWKAPLQRAVPSNPRGYIDLDYPAEARKHMKLPSPPPKMRSIQLSDDEDMVEPVRPTMRSSRAAGGNAVGAVKTRLESSSSRLQQPSHSSTLGSGPSGYRIVVSNLQSSVTHEDIRELFEDVGPLVTSRLVRPGTAEVVYSQYKDAERAVENYHNRQLDGQPMKCLLVKPRPSTSASAAPSGSLRTSVGPSSKSSGGGKPTVVPDISTIHKALFNKS